MLGLQELSAIRRLSTRVGLESLEGSVICSLLEQDLALHSITGVSFMN